MFDQQQDQVEEMRRSLVAVVADDDDDDEVCFGNRDLVGDQTNNNHNSETSEEVDESSNIKQKQSTDSMDMILKNFTFMSILFSINHGCVVACLTLATSRLGIALGSYQSGLLYLSYTISALSGSGTLLVQQFGSKYSIIIGMALYAIYVGCFVVALQIMGSSSHHHDDATNAAAKYVAYTGAIVGGSGAGCLWTAQGSYFSHAAQAYDKALLFQQDQNGNNLQEKEPAFWRGLYQYLHNLFATTFSCCAYTNNSSPSAFCQKKRSSSTQQPQQSSIGTTKLAGIFAFWYLSSEVAMRLFSSVVLECFHEVISWEKIFTFYTVLTLLSAVGMFGIEDYHDSDEIHHLHDDSDEEETENNNNDEVNVNTTTRRNMKNNTKWWHNKATITIRMLIYDSKMKYLVGMNAIFGMTSAYVNTYVNGEIVPILLDDPNSKYIGILSSYTSGVAAIMSLLFVKMTPYTGRGFILITGTIAFVGVVVLSSSQQQSILNHLHHQNNNNNNDHEDDSSSSTTFAAWILLLVVYGLMGIGRSTFEGTLKATFADYFPYQKEGAFANIILQNGFFTSLSYVAITFLLPARRDFDSSTHQSFLVVFEILVLVMAMVAILGYLQASRIHQREEQQQKQQASSLLQGYNNNNNNNNNSSGGGDNEDFDAEDPTATTTTEVAQHYSNLLHRDNILRK